MTTTDELFVRADPWMCFHVAADVERWPDILPHYRWVRFHEKRAFGEGRVEMSARRDFAFGYYPAWWVSEMISDQREPAVYYRHVEGITRGMNVKWAFEPRPGGTLIRITHAWNGPDWPLIGGIAWEWVIAPHFVNFIAARTLRGVGAEAERRAERDARSGGPPGNDREASHA
jgi:ribosome-associated toxin RatA of RatAB toxin-antitoxin module